MLKIRIVKSKLKEVGLFPYVSLAGYHDVDKDRGCEDCETRATQSRVVEESRREYLNESVFYISIDKILPTEELGHGKDHDCPGEECEEIVQSKMSDIEQGNFEPIQICNQKPVVTARLSGKEDYTPAPKSGQEEPFFHILDGHHRLEAAKRLGLDKIPVVQVQKEQTEPFQKAVKKNYRKMKMRLTATGPNKYNVGGKMEKPPMARSKSAPVGFGGSLEEEQIEEKKKKPCKKAKGKKYVKRVDGKCRSYGQAGKAKDGGDRIRPGTKKGDAYCARSLKIKKCKNPPCANALSRKKWKCSGSKSIAEETK